MESRPLCKRAAFDTEGKCQKYWVLIHARFRKVIVDTFAGRLDRIGFGGGRYAKVPPALVAFGHGLGQNLRVDDAGNGFLLCGADSFAELLRGLGGEALHAVALADLRKIGVAVGSVQLAGFGIAVAHFGRQRADAVAHLQIVDAAERRVVKDDMVIFAPS